MTLGDFVKQHPEWMDHTLVVYSWSGVYDYVGDDGRGSVYADDEMKDVPGKDCEPTGRKLLVFAGN